MSEPAARDYAGFLVELKTRIRRGQYQALRAVNAELVGLYWDIGEAIHRKLESLGWGRSVVETLARDLQAEFPGPNGLSAKNLWRMRQFYVLYRDRPKLAPLVREISWAKIGAFQPEHKGKMEFYLEALDAQERMEGENPPIGIIICRDKNVTVVEYFMTSPSATQTG